MAEPAFVFTPPRLSESGRSRLRSLVRVRKDAGASPQLRKTQSLAHPVLGGCRPAGLSSPGSEHPAPLQSESSARGLAFDAGRGLRAASPGARVQKVRDQAFEVCPLPAKSAWTSKCAIPPFRAVLCSDCYSREAPVFRKRKGRRRRGADQRCSSEPYSVCRVLTELPKEIWRGLKLGFARPNRSAALSRNQGHLFRSCFKTLFSLLGISIPEFPF